MAKLDLNRIVPTSFDPNPLCWEMIKYISDNKDKINPATGEQQRINIFNEGGGRSGKSFDAYALLIALCDKNRKLPISIYVVRKTLKNAREIAYWEDFFTLLKIFGLYYPELARNENQSPEYTLWGSTIKFIGLDTSEELGKTDVIYVNEALDINNEKVFNNLILRCEMLLICDWNPKYSSHFIFKWEGRFNTLWTHTTFVNNKHLKSSVRAQILSYCPWDFKDFDFETGLWNCSIEERSPNEYNLHENTVNLHDWMVYGEGIRCAEEGAVFKNVNYIDEFPDDCEEVHYGLDFGYTNDPSVLTMVGRSGKNIYIKYLTYICFDDTDIMYQHIMPMLLEEQGRRKKEACGHDIANIVVACDSSDKYKDVHFVRALNANISSDNKHIEAENIRNKRDPEFGKIHGIQFTKVKKPMVTVRLSLMKKFFIHVVKDTNAENEFLNYTYLMIEGKQTNIPIDAWNHGIDSANYCIWLFWKWYFGS